jgi:hypothetical protein
MSYRQVVWSGPRRLFCLGLVSSLIPTPLRPVTFASVSANGLRVPYTCRLLALVVALGVAFNLIVHIVAHVIGFLLTEKLRFFAASYRHEATHDRCRQSTQMFGRVCWNFPGLQNG